MQNQPSGKQLEEVDDGQTLNASALIKNPTGSDVQEEGNHATQGEIAKLEDRIRGAEKWMIWLTGAIALFALGSVVVGVLQWSVIKSGGTDTHTLAVAAQTQAINMRNMSDAADKISQAAQDMVKQEQRIADNAQRALNASNKQSQRVLNANIAESQLDQRAWVGIVSLPPPKDLTLGQKATFGVIFNNTGKTPALKVMGMIAESPFPQNQSFVVNYPPMSSESSIAVIQPGTQQSVWTEPQPQVNTEASIASIKDGRVIIYFYGQITYEDIFGRTHHTHFCGWVKPDLTGYHVCGTYNDAD